MSIHVLCPCFNRVVCSFDVEFVNFLYILDINLCQIYFFSHSVGCLLILLIVFFTVQKLFSLIRFHLFIFALFPLPEEMYPKNISETDIKEHTVYIYF